MKKPLPLAAVIVLSIFTNCAPFPTTHPMPSPPENTNRDDSYVGLSLERAQQLADSRGLRHRVVMRDGRSLPVTKDFRPERLNFTVNDGVVVDLTKG